MSYVLALKEFNKTCYPTKKKLSFTDIGKYKDEVLVYITSPPNYTSLMGRGKTLPEAKESAAKAWLEMWRDWCNSGADMRVDWEAIEKIAGQKIVAQKDEDEHE